MGKGKEIVIAKKDIKKGHIIEDNDIEGYDFNLRRSLSNFVSIRVDDTPIDKNAQYIREDLKKPFLGLRAIVNIPKEAKLKSTYFEDAKLQIERDKKNQTIKERIKFQMKNNIWL